MDCSTPGLPVLHQSQNLLKLTSVESVMPSNQLILCPLLLPSIFPSIRVFSNGLVLHIMWPKYWSFNFSIIQFIQWIFRIDFNYTLLFLLINTLLISVLSIFVGILFCKAEGPGPLSLTTDLVARIWCFHCCFPATISWEPKPCSKPLPTEATRDHNDIC